jgi:hypothetical protein
MKNVLWVLIIGSFLFTACSCAVVGNLDEALTLKEYSDERDAIQADVQAADARVDKLLTRVRSKASFEGYDRNKFVEEFGQPVLIKQISRHDQEQESWLYRYAVDRGMTPKIYVFFKPDGTWDGLSAEGL